MRERSGRRPKGRWQGQKGQKGEHKKAICSLDNVHWTKHYSCNTVYGGSSLSNLGYSSATRIYISSFVGMKEGDVVLEIDKAALAY